MLAKNIQYAVNDSEISRLTGCLSSCDKYHYIANSNTDLRSYRSYTDSFEIAFMMSNGRNEVKEQVRHVDRRAMRSKI